MCPSASTKRSSEALSVTAMLHLLVRIAAYAPPGDERLDRTGDARSLLVVRLERNVEVRMGDHLPALLGANEHREPRRGISRLRHSLDRHDRLDVVAHDDHVARARRPQFAQLVRL